MKNSSTESSTVTTGDPVTVNANEKTWLELVAPTIERCELAAKFGMRATWNSDGAAALGELLKKMATLLDNEISTLTHNEEVVVSNSTHHSGRWD